ncbi:sel1 repeat family protein [Candidatus Pseudothioglobus singularis]|nr:sel1 repeat family protein [Candidatus Pseudothioglobus singularis]
MKKIVLALILIFGFSITLNANTENCINSFESEDYQNASIECIEPANLGEIYPQNILGWLYLKGLGFSIDNQKAFEWLSKSSDQGNPWAKGQLGLIYQNGNESVQRDYSQALLFFTEAGEDWIEELKTLETLIQKEEINKSIKKVKVMKSISANKIGKWYTSKSDIENETCNGEDTSELLILHDQILHRVYSQDYSFLEGNPESTYYNFYDERNLHFFSNNIINFSNYESEILDIYFEELMFPNLKSNNGYISIKVFKCENLNNQIDYILLERDAIEFDKLVYAAKEECQNKKPIDCLRKFVNFADVSRNNELSRAELTRFSKFIIKWLTLKGELNLTERMSSSVAVMVLGPALAEFILLNYDYDNDDHIDIKEMTFDLVNITGSSELYNKLIRRYIEALDLVSESKVNASRMIDDLL